MSLVGMAESLFQSRIELRAQPLMVRGDLRARRPIARLIRGQPAANRINPKSKKLIEGRIKAPQAKRPFAQQIPVECFHVAQIEYNAMTLGNGSLVECVVAQDLE